MIRIFLGIEIDEEKNPICTRILDEDEESIIGRYSIIRHPTKIVHTGQYLVKEKDGITTIHHFTIVEPIFEKGRFLYKEDISPKKRPLEQDIGENTKKIRIK
jgi:hypothetical protein